MLLYHLRGGGGCQNPSNDICDSPGLASHPGLTVTALLQSTVNRRKKIDNLYCNVIPCHPASQRCDPLSTEGKKNRQSVLQCDSLSSCTSTHDLWPHPACHFCKVQRSVLSYPISAKGEHVYAGGGGGRADRTGGGGGG